MAERLKFHPEIVDLLGQHEIGYHSSGHSVHPTLFEFTDVESYEEAYQTSKIRETSYINPLTGEVEGRGGILTVQQLSKSAPVTSFRAPGMCWSPPHAEALRDLGIKYDFSTNLYPMPFRQKGLTFYPYPVTGDWKGNMLDYQRVLYSIMRNKVTLVASHPSLFMNKGDWDAIYWKGNPKQLACPKPRSASEIESLFQRFDLLLKRLKSLKKKGVIEITPCLKQIGKNLPFTRETVDKCHEFSVRWPQIIFDYRPKFLRNHFYTFFNISLSKPNATSHSTTKIKSS